MVCIKKLNQLFKPLLWTFIFRLITRPESKTVICCCHNRHSICCIIWKKLVLQDFKAF